MGHQQQMYKSAECIDESDEDILEIISSKTDTSFLSLNRGTLLQVMHDSINCELDAMSPIPKPVPVPVQSPSPPPKQAMKPKKKKVLFKCSEAPLTEPKPIIATVEPAHEVTYNVLILPYAEIKKDNNSLTSKSIKTENLTRRMEVVVRIAVMKSREEEEKKEDSKNKGTLNVVKTARMLHHSLNFQALKASDIDDKMKPVNWNITKLTDCWEKSPNYVTLEMPLNHSYFSMVLVELPTGPVPASSGPVVNVNFPPELFQAI
ncbi:uncharacterized protein F5147DRAFT_656128 [Suillus discolor]|uniref:Uncharacterized protein n=1 Tax=Suillus discolor TaxID=1912936 RepID=A0A9P7JQI1_9AGAM|nr:uncharacterized protein F5147DRAFT_656128 [Suillus discolor]KAG2098239.1 hypothetical protein F5147DRAFT_656128 [Suillus discolor]